MLKLLCILALALQLGVLVANAYPAIKYVNSTSRAPRWQTFENGTGRLGIVECCGGAVMRSYQNYYFHGTFTAMIRLHKGFSAGIVSTFYLRSHGAYWDEIDYEFLGNTDSKNMILHTNYFAQGKGGNEEQYQFWFDPADGYHNYTIWWTWEHVAWIVDGVVIRVLQRPKYAPYSAPGFVKQPMLVYGSIWDGSGWASNGGNIKSDYSKGPFFIYYGSLDFSQTCLYSPGVACASRSRKNSWDGSLTASQLRTMNTYRKRYLTFSYQYPR